jgi:hypothetical protein
MIVTLLEEIHWLVIIAGGFLCDSPEGEEPSVPAAVANLSLAASSRNQADPIMGLISIVMHIANFEKDCLVNKKVIRHIYFNQKKKVFKYSIYRMTCGVR